MRKACGTIHNGADKEEPNGQRNGRDHLAEEKEEAAQTLGCGQHVNEDDSSIC
jgi:hypothetical protein